jgi:hypothetical protein
MAGVLPLAFWGQCPARRWRESLRLSPLMLCAPPLASLQGRRLLCLSWIDKGLRPLSFLWAVQCPPACAFLVKVLLLPLALTLNLLCDILQLEG